MYVIALYCSNAEYYNLKVEFSYLTGLFKYLNKRRLCLTRVMCFIGASCAMIPTSPLSQTTFPRTPPNSASRKPTSAACQRILSLPQQPGVSLDVLQLALLPQCGQFPRTLHLGRITVGWECSHFLSVGMFDGYAEPSAPGFAQQ